MLSERVSLFILGVGSLSLCLNLPKYLPNTLFFRMNEEFLDQLALFELMDCEVDTTKPLYKQFRLRKITEKYPGVCSLTVLYFKTY